MHKAFQILAYGKPELEPWFNIVHCDACGAFTARPIFLGCAENHTFCGICLLAHMKLMGKTCPTCSHSFSAPDPLTFQAHVHALLGLVETRMAPTARQMRADIKELEATEDFVAAILAASCSSAKQRH